MTSQSDDVMDTDYIVLVQDHLNMWTTATQIAAISSKPIKHMEYLVARKGIQCGSTRGDLLAGQGGGLTWNKSVQAATCKIIWLYLLFIQ